MTIKMDIVFFGTTEVSLKFLESVYQQEKVLAVITKPDKPAGRGLRIVENCIKKFSLIKNIPVLTPENLLEESFISQLKTLQLHLGVVVGYGKILPTCIYSIPKYGTVNVHFSLLPKYRGPAPIQRAIMSGEKTTGVTIFFLNDGIDTGEIILQKEVAISEEDTAVTLQHKLTKIGIEALSEVISLLKTAGKINTKPQSLEGATFAPKLTKEEGKIDWQKTSYEINNLIRGAQPWPSAYTFVSLKGKLQMLKIISAKVLLLEDEVTLKSQVGEIVAVEKNAGFVVKTGTTEDSNALLVEQVQPEGKKVMSGWAYWLGARLKIGTKFQ